MRPAPVPGRRGDAPGDGARGAGFTSLIPFLVVGAAFGPADSDLPERIVDRFDLHGSAARSVEQLFNDSGQVESAVTWVSVVLLILAALSFTRALQRMYQRAWTSSQASTETATACASRRRR